MSKARPRKKGYRQAHLKRFHGEFINAGKKANSQYLQESFARTRSLKTGDVDVTNYSNFEPTVQTACTYLEPEDVVLVRLKEMWQTDFWQGVTTYHRINLILSEERNLFLFFEGESFFFVAEYPKKKIVKRSVIYSSRRIAFMHMDAGKITWVTKPGEARYDLPR